MDHFTAWRAAKRFFAKFFDFLFDKRARIIFVFASLYPTFFLLIATVFVINYGLECFANFGIAYIYQSAHILFEY